MQHNTTTYKSMARFFVNGSGIQSSLCFSIIWFRKASTCPELLDIGQDGNTKTGEVHLLRKNRANWLKKIIYMLFVENLVENSAAVPVRGYSCLQICSLA